MVVIKIIKGLEIVLLLLGIAAEGLEIKRAVSLFNQVKGSSLANLTTAGLVQGGDEPNNTLGLGFFVTSRIFISMSPFWSYTVTKK